MDLRCDYIMMETYLQYSIGRRTYKVKQSYYYCDEFWVSIEGKYAKVGITDVFQKTCGAIVRVHLFLGKKVSQFEVIGRMESIYTVVPIISPISGRVLELNPILEDEVFLINESPYEDGWIAKLELAEGYEREVEKLEVAEDYFETMKKRLERSREGNKLNP